MREPVRDRDRLEHIVEAIDRILDNTDFKSRDELEADNLSPQEPRTDRRADEAARLRHRGDMQDNGAGA